MNFTYPGQLLQLAMGACHQDLLRTHPLKYSGGWFCGTDAFRYLQMRSSIGALVPTPSPRRRFPARGARSDAFQLWQLMDVDWPTRPPTDVFRLGGRAADAFQRTR